MDNLGTRGSVTAALAVLLFTCWAACVPAAHAETRVALVIGNDSYQGVPQLANPINDAELVAKSLRSVGFNDVDVETNLDRAKLVAALKGFTAKARNADVAVVYFAGHGIEMGGINYLIPTDATLATDTDVQFDAVSLDMALTAVSGARVMQLVVMDACRNNPFATHMHVTGIKRAVTRGLAPVVPNDNTLVLFSARDGTTAEDGAGANSPFAEAFANDIRKPLEIGKFTRLVRDDVLTKTGQRQEPYLYGSISAADFYFMPGGTVVNNTTIVNAQGSAAPDPKTIELEYWQSVRDSSDPSQLEAYIRAYPNGIFADLARDKLAALKSGHNTPPTMHSELSAISAESLSKSPFFLEQPKSAITQADFKSLPIAGEFSKREIRYIWVYLNKIASAGVVLPQCLSPSSYIVWFFEGAGTTVRGVSLRLAPTEDCQGDSAPYLQFLRAAGVVDGGAQTFEKPQTIRYRGLNVVVSAPAGDLERIDLLEPDLPVPDFAPPPPGS